jgi:hypothetical protein
MATRQLDLDFEKEPETPLEVREISTKVIDLESRRLRAKDADKNALLASILDSVRHLRG